MTPTQHSSHVSTHNPRSRISSPAHLQDYEEFMSDPDPFSMTAEIANLRTLQVEFRKSIETKGDQERNDFYVSMALSLARFLHSDERFGSAFTDKDEKAAYIRDVARNMVPIVRNVFEAKFGRDNTISMDQAKTLASLMETTGKACERQTKLLERKKTSVKYDDQLMSTLLMFVTQVVLPNMSNMQERAALASATKLWLPSRIKE